jgi:hypothetical protein
MSRIRGYAAPALTGEAAAGEAALGFGGGVLAPLAGGLAAGAAYDAFTRQVAYTAHKYTRPPEKGEVSFSVDGGSPMDPYRKKKAR